MITRDKASAAAKNIAIMDYNSKIRLCTSRIPDNDNTWNSANIAYIALSSLGRLGLRGLETLEPVIRSVSGGTDY